MVIQLTFRLDHKYHDQPSLARAEYIAIGRGTFSSVSASVGPLDFVRVLSQRVLCMAMCAMLWLEKLTLIKKYQLNPYTYVSKPHGQPCRDGLSTSCSFYSKLNICFYWFPYGVIDFLVSAYEYKCHSNVTLHPAEPAKLAEPAKPAILSAMSRVKLWRYAGYMMI